MASTPNDDQPRFVYGEETQYAVVSYRGKAHYIGPFTDRESAITAAKHAVEIWDGPGTASSEGGDAPKEARDWGSLQLRRVLKLTQSSD